MKKESISTFIIALVVLSSWLTPTSLHAQEAQFTSKEEKNDSAFFQGIYVGVDVFGFLNQVLGSDAKTTEASVEVNLMNRFFPVVELGYGSMDTTDDETDIRFKTKAPFFRIGANYNVFYKKPYLPGHFLVGLRYGFSSFSYDVSAPPLTDPIWGKPSIPFSYQGVKSNASWLELAIGLRANIYKNLYMGLSLRYRSKISIKKNENSDPYYIPGYGKNKGSNIGILYNITYQLPF